MSDLAAEYGRPEQRSKWRLRPNDESCLCWGVRRAILVGPEQAVRSDKGSPSMSGGLGRLERVLFVGKTEALEAFKSVVLDLGKELDAGGSEALPQ